MDGMQAERMAREKEEEDEFRRQTMDRFAEQDRLEQMNAQKRRIKVAQHAREVERLIQEKRAMFEAAMVSTLSLMMAFAKAFVQSFYPHMGFKCSPYNHHHRSFRHTTYSSVASVVWILTGAHDACALRHSQAACCSPWPCCQQVKHHTQRLKQLGELHFTKHTQGEEEEGVYMLRPVNKTDHMCQDTKVLTKH